MFLEDRREFPKVTLRKPERCAARCGATAEPHDIYCQECRDEITGEAWLLIEIEEPGT